MPTGADPFPTTMNCTEESIMRNYDWNWPAKQPAPCV